MSVRNIILILAALLITAGTGMVARSWLNSQTQTAAPVQPEVKITHVLVALKNLPTGTFVTENQLIWQAWPGEKLNESYLIKGKFDEKSLLGSVVRRGLTAGEPVTSARIVQPGQRGFLAAVLRPGYRAVAIRVNATTSIAGLIFPGDRVDILLSHKVNRDSGARRVSETILSNVRILAIDQKVDEQEGVPKKPKVGKNATLEVTPKQAEMLTIVGDLGKLSLVLRSLAKDEEELSHIVNSDEPLAEPDPERGKTHTWDTEVSRLLIRPSAVANEVEVIRGGVTKKLKVGKGKKPEEVTPQAEVKKDEE